MPLYILTRTSGEAEREHHSGQRAMFEDQLGQSQKQPEFEILKSLFSLF